MAELLMDIYGNFHDSCIVFMNYLAEHLWMMTEPYIMEMKTIEICKDYYISV